MKYRFYEFPLEHIFSFQFSSAIYTFLQLLPNLPITKFALANKEIIKLSVAIIFCVAETQIWRQSRRKQKSSS